MNEQNKVAMLTVKLTPSRMEEFRIAAVLRGTTMSALVSQFVAQVVREEMATVPEAFSRRLSTKSSFSMQINRLKDLKEDSN